MSDTGQNILNTVLWGNSDNTLFLPKKASRGSGNARSRRLTRASLSTALSFLACAAATAAHADELDDEQATTGITVEGRKSANAATSATGLDISILDTPRTVTAIDASQLRDQSIESVRDLSKVVPSAYTQTQFGGANIPALRGQSAEIFQNGVLRTPRSNGLPLSFNAVEGLDVVKGPAGVVYGPTGNVGGYVNFVTKKPSFDGFKATVNLSYGSWEDKRAQVDVSGPLSETVAVRVAYERVDADSYYRYGFMDSHDVYGAISFKPSDRLSLDFNVEYYHADFVENTGINRPTQELIDDGLYYQGIGVSPFGTPSDPRNFGAVINVTGVVPINRRFQLVAPDDYAQGSDLVAQFVGTYQLGDGLTLINRTSYESYKQRKVENAQRYYNYIPKSHNFQSRLELVADLGKHKLIGGVSYLRYSVKSYSDFFNEYLNATDITADPATYPITSVFGVVQVPGRPAGEFAAPGAAYGSPLYPFAIAGTRDEDSNQIGLFGQGIFELADGLSLLVAGRVDRIHEDLKDPLPPPGLTAARDTATEWLKSFNASVTFKPSAGATFYATVNYNESAVVGGGGGFAPFSGKVIDTNAFHIDNYLYEAGAKFSLLNEKLFLTTALFHQQRSETNFLARTNKVRARGLELQASYRPNENFSATASYGFLDTKLLNATVSAFTGDVYDAFAAPYGTGLGSPNFRPLPVGDYRVPGYPKHLLNAFAKYKSDLGLGASLGLVVTGPMYTSYLQTVKIPSQHQLDATLFYEKDEWAVFADFFNITGQKNWSAGGGANGNDLIIADLPFHFRFGIRRQF